MFNITKYSQGKGGLSSQRVKVAPQYEMSLQALSK